MNAGADWEGPDRATRVHGRRTVLLVLLLLAVAVAVVALARPGPRPSELQVRPAPDTQGPRESLGLDRNPPSATVLPPATVPPAGGRWTLLPSAPLAGRSGHVAVWTGEQLIVWGGRGPRARGDGAALDPARGVWTPLADAPLAPRSHPAAAWTGTELVIWGGMGEGAPLSDGAAYDPATDAWEPLPAAPLAPTIGPVAVWTGKELVVWGGVTDGTGTVEGGHARREGAAYDPASSQWRPISLAPEGARFPLARGLWTGEHVFVWGGQEAFAYDPHADAWRTLPRPPLAAVGLLSLSRAGDAVVLTGRFLKGPEPAGGLGWVAGHWRLLAPPGVEREFHAAVGAGNSVLVWGGIGPDAKHLRSGLRLPDIVSEWEALPDAPIRGRLGAEAVWTGDRLLVWGGAAGEEFFADGAAWTPGG